MIQRLSIIWLSIIIEYATFPLALLVPFPFYGAKLYFLRCLALIMATLWFWWNYRTWTAAMTQWSIDFCSWVIIIVSFILICFRAKWLVQVLGRHLLGIFVFAVAVFMPLWWLFMRIVLNLILFVAVLIYKWAEVWLVIILPVAIAFFLLEVAILYFQAIEKLL